MSTGWTVRVPCIAIILLAGIRSALAATPSTRPSLEPGNSNRLSEIESVPVHGFAFEGNTVFSKPQLEQIANAVLTKHPDGRLTSEDLDEIRNQITLLYINKGFINSGAVLPDQTVTDGIIHYRIIEGKLSEIRLTRGKPSMEMATTIPSTSHANMPPGMNMGTQAQTPPGTHEPSHELPETISAHAPAYSFHMLRDSFIISRVKLGAGPPLNLKDLKQQLELLRQEPNIQAVNAELTPGDQLGESILNLGITERNPFQFGVEFSNPRSPSVGAYEVDALFSDTDLLGFGDSLAVRYGLFVGDIDDLKFDAPKDYSIDYSIPFTPYDTTAEFNYTRSSDLVVEAPFNDVDIQSATDGYAAAISQPIIHRPNEELDMSVGLTARYNTTYLLGQPFSLAPGAVNGVSNAVAIRFSQQYSTKSDTQAIALRSTFGFGIDAMDATVSSSRPDGRFFDWLGQFQYVRRLSGWGIAADSDAQFIGRFTAQLSADPLLAVEQFGLGGMDTVRGYREQQIVSDNAVVASVELRFPLIEKSHQDILDVAPFFDAGYGWDARNSEMEPELISAPGVGLLLNVTSHLTAAVYYGYALKKFPQSTHDLQDSGISFTLTLTAF
jgi:hemolysin activation/secretion protein